MNHCDSDASVPNRQWYHPGEGRGGEQGGSRLPDTHAHLDSPVFARQHRDVIRRATDAGISRILTVGSDLRSSEMAVKLAQEFEGVFAAVGIHPHEAARFESEAPGVRSLLRESKVVAVGEIGLDYYRHVDTRDQQLAVYKEQIRWASTLSLPVSVHNRSADVDVLSPLASECVKGVLHCFSGSWELACDAMRDGHLVSFAGNLTFPKSGMLREIASRVPDGRILIETDAPALAPQTWRGRQNEPAYIVSTARVLADIRGLSLPELCAVVCRNADTVFHWGVS